LLGFSICLTYFRPKNVIMQGKDVKNKKKLKPIRLIKKANDLIEARHSLTTWEMRIFLKILFLVNEEKYKGATNFIIPIRELIHDFKLENNKNSYKLFREAREALATRSIQIFQDNKDTGSWERVNKTLFVETAHSVKISKDGIVTDDEDGYIRLQLSEQIKPYLLNIDGSLDRNYTLFDKNYAIELSLKMLRFYLLLKRFADTGVRDMSVDELRDVFDLQDKYKSFGNIKQRIIDKAQQELAAKTDIRFEYEEIKQSGSKAVTRIRFRIFSNTPTNAVPAELPPARVGEKSNDKTTIAISEKWTEKTTETPPSVNSTEFDALFDQFFPQLRTYGISATTLTQWIHQYPAAHIQACVQEFLSKAQQGKIRESDPLKQGGYLRALLEHADFSEKQKEVTRKAEIQQRQTQAEQAAANAAELKKQNAIAQFERERLIAIEIFAENPTLEQTILDSFNRRDATQYTLDDVPKLPFLVSKLLWAVKQQFPEKFGLQ
jgi:plasmid replication initiation protein